MQVDGERGRGADPGPPAPRRPGDPGRALVRVAAHTDALVDETLDVFEDALRDI